MARTTVEYWQHVGTGEVFAVRVDAAGHIVSAHGPLSAADIGAALFGAPARGAALCDLPMPADTPADTPANAETDVARLPGPCARCHPRRGGGLHHSPALALRPPGHRAPRR